MAEAVDQAHALVALDEEAAALHEQLRVAEQRAVQLEQRLRESELERERAQHEAESRFEDMKTFMVGLCDNLKAANAELNERLNELLNATKEAPPSQHMLMKSSMRSMEETIQALRAENATLRLQTALPRKGCLKNSGALATAAAHPTAGAVACASAESLEFAEAEAQAQAEAEAEVQANVEAKMEAGANVTPTEEMVSAAEARPVAEAKVGAEAARKLEPPVGEGARVEALTRPMAEAKHSCSEAHDDADELTIVRPQVEDRPMAAQLRLPTPSVPKLACGVPPMPKLACGAGSGTVPTLNLSALAPATVLGDRPDEDDRRPPTPPAVIVERILNARLAAEEREALSQDASPRAKAIDCAGALTTSSPHGEESAPQSDCSPAVGEGDLEAEETEERRGSIVTAVVDWFKGFDASQAQGAQ